MFVRLGVALRLDEGVHGSLQQLAAEAAVQLGDGVSWENIKKHQARFTRGRGRSKKHTSEGTLANNAADYLFASL